MKRIHVIICLIMALLIIRCQNNDQTNTSGSPENIYHIDIKKYPADTVEHHAGKNETSWMMYLRPDNTNLSMITPGDYFYRCRKDDESNKASSEWGMWKDICNDYVLRDGDKAILIDLGDGRVLNALQLVIA